MTLPDAARLARLAEIAQMRSDAALADLSEATAQTRALRLRIAEIDRAGRSALCGAEDPVSGAVALKFVRAGQEKRRALLQALATAEARRLQAQTRARAEEGRRQVLAKLSAQAS